MEADIVTLVSELEKRKQLDAAGGAANVAALTNVICSTANMPFYETEVLAAYRGRAAWKAAAMAKEALERGESPDTVSAGLTAAMEGITTSGAVSGEDNGILFSELLTKQFPPKNGWWTALSQPD
jgi:replicative DNA helicase